jgi:hypothetical protein
MRSAGNFHPQWGYLAPAPSFLRSARIVLVATAVGATAGAAVVVSLLGRPGVDADNSLAAHALVTSAPVTAAPPVFATGTPAPIAAAQGSKGLLAQAPAGAATPEPMQSQPASPKPVLVNGDSATANNAPSSTQPAPLAHSAAESKPAAPAKRSVGRRHRTASNDRRWQGENGWRKRRQRDNGSAPLFGFRLFSSRGGSSGDYPN